MNEIYKLYCSNLTGRFTLYVRIRWLRNAWKNLSVLTYPDGSEVTYGYDSYGRVISITDTEGNVVTYEYDIQGRKTKQIDGETTTEYSYDAGGKAILKASLSEMSVLASQGKLNVKETERIS